MTNWIIYLLCLWLYSFYITLFAFRKLVILFFINILHWIVREKREKKEHQIVIRPNKINVIRCERGASLRNERTSFNLSLVIHLKCERARLGSWEGRFNYIISTFFFAFNDKNLFSYFSYRVSLSLSPFYLSLSL